MDNHDENRGNTYFHAFALSIFLIGFGLFVTFGTFGFLSFIGIPMILFGFYVGYMEARDGARGRSWYGRRQLDKPAME